METIIFFASFYWNPNREAFSIPFIHHPIMWYGICFVLAFIIGYYICIPLFNRVLHQIQSIALCDINDWNTLINQLKNPISSLSIPHALQITLNELNPDKPIPLLTKQEILDAINNLKIDRDQLPILFPNGIAPVKQTSIFLIDRFCWFVVAGTIVGARLGHVFFYDWERYREHPLDILKTWEGGLASHGGAIGILLAIYLYQRYIKQWYPTFSFLKLLDIISIPTALGCCFIRVGNFINQEILGTPTNLPWGVIFGNPADHEAPIPRHPVQLYEALAYLVIFFILSFVWIKGKNWLRTGMLISLFFIFGFSARFFLEFFKETQESVINQSIIQMGQLLSIPFIVIGIILFVYSYKSKE